MDLNLSTKEFGKLTPKMFAALVDRLKAKDQKLYLAAGIIAATVSNTAPFGDPNRKAVSPMDFVPGYKEQQDFKREMSTDEIVDVLSAAFGCGPSAQKGGQ